MFHAGKQHEIDYISTGSMTCWHKGRNGFSLLPLLFLRVSARCWQAAGIFDNPRGDFVSTVKREEQVIREYIRHLETDGWAAL